MRLLIVLESFFWQISTFNLFAKASILTPKGTTITLFYSNQLLVLFVAVVSVNTINIECVATARQNR